MLGTVTMLRRYPVKSMLGEGIGHRADVTATGLAGDRGHALVHRTTGRVVSAKNPRLWRAMLTLRAAVAGDGIAITFPCGKTASSADPDIDEVLSAFLGQPVTLAGTPPDGAVMEHADPADVIRDGVAAEVRTELIPLGGGTFFNFAALHLLTTSTLARITELGTAAELVRYRPNIVVDTPGSPGFTENGWLDKDLAIGEAVIRVIARTPRCAVPTLQHGATIGKDPAALAVLTDHNRIPALRGLVPQPCAGVYAQVVRPGRVSVNDPVVLA